jgi:hypothetical protein
VLQKYPDEVRDFLEREERLRQRRERLAGRLPPMTPEEQRARARENYRRRREREKREQEKWAEFILIPLGRDDR